jgi:hypothetical protein
MNWHSKLFLLSNPVKTVLQFQMIPLLTKLLLSLLKETLLTKKLNSLSTEIDLSNLSTGVYF